MSSSKVCTKCKIEKPLDQFYRGNDTVLGYRCACKQCIIKQSIKHRAANPRSREYTVLYRQTKSGKESAAKAVRKWNDKNRSKIRAMLRLNYAIGRGYIKSLPCFVCGEKAHAHHPDYSRPLDVMWLCPAHHKQAHMAAK